MQQFPQGVWPVVLTPFRENGSIDYTGYGALLDYYLTHGVTGLFAVCLSSELYQLSDEERVELARFTVKHTAGRVPVVGCGGFGADFDEKADSIKRMADTGLDAVVVPACLAAPREASEPEFIEAFLKLMDATGSVRLGIYECPLPYHRLISPKGLGELARSGGARLPFIKDTCCDRPTIAAKLAECKGTKLALYNANLTTFLGSLRDGAAGYSGTSANFYPELLAEMCRIYRTEPEKADRMQQFFNLIQRHVEFKYPRGPKLYLKMCGVSITSFCRVGCETFTADQMEHMKVLYEAIREFKLANSIAL